MAAPGPVLPPVFSSTRTSLITAAGSIALTMSISASAATVTEVSASISTPVRSAVRDRRRDRHAVVLDGQVDGDRVQRDRVAQRDQVRGPLGALDPGDPGHRERVALGDLPGPQRGDGLGRQQDPAGRARPPARSRPWRRRRPSGRARPRRGGSSRAGPLVVTRPATLRQAGLALASIRVTSSGTMISALARASAPSWCEPWPVSGMTVSCPASSTPRR